MFLASTYMQILKSNIIIILFLCSFNIVGQTNSLVKGTVLDYKTQNPLPGATIYLENLSDTLKSIGAITDYDGKINLTINQGVYHLNISYLGYTNFNDTINVNQETFLLDTIKLQEKKSIIKEVDVVSNLAPSFQKGDTTIFNPEAFKVSLDATAGDLLLKMPGFYHIEGKLIAMGDTIKEVLMDGKKIFGENISQALEMIPPKIIKKIEVYQYKSDETKHSGFEENTEGKTVNVITNLKTEDFIRAEVGAGKGKDNRCVGEAYYRRFSEKKRVGVNASKNNISVPLKINRFGGQNSISGDKVKNNNINANVGLSKASDINFNYAYNDSENESQNSFNREYVAGSLNGRKLYNINYSNNETKNQRASLNWNTHKVSKYMITSSIQYTSNNAENNSSSQSETLQNNDLINSTDNNNVSDNSSLLVDGNINITRKLNKKGTSIATNVQYTYNSSQNNYKQNSETINEEDITTQSIDQLSNRENLNKNLSIGLSFNEKLGKNGHLSVGYRFLNYIQESDKRTYDFDKNVQQYNQLDSLTSSNYNNFNYIHVTKLGYRVKQKNIRTYIGIDYKNTTMKSKETFPEHFVLKKHFNSFSPQINLSYTSEKKKNYTLNYGMNQQIPSLQSLQDVVDNSNPLYISSGNPNLKPAFSHNIVFSFFSSNTKKSSLTTIQMRASMINNMVSQNRIVAVNDTVILGSYELPAGGQFSQPININGRYTLAISSTFSFPVKKLKSNLNSRTEIRYSHSPNILNNIKNYSNQSSATQNFTLSSNINEKIDFTITSTSSYSIVNNNSGTTNQLGYITQNSGVNLYWNFYKNFIFKTNTSQLFSESSGSLASNNKWYINLCLSKKLFKKNQGDISLSVYDIANNKDDVIRTVDDLYIAESYRKTLNQFYLVSFTYSL